MPRRRDHGGMNLSEEAKSLLRAIYDIEVLTDHHRNIYASQLQAQLEASYGAKWGAEVFHKRLRALSDNGLLHNVRRMENGPGKIWNFDGLTDEGRALAESIPPSIEVTAN